jgi:gas vesicle protein
MCDNQFCKNIRNRLLIGVKINESKSECYRELLKEVSEDGKNLSELMPKIINQHIEEINDIIKNHETEIKDIKSDYEEKINKLQEQLEYYQRKCIEFYISSDEDEYYSEEDDELDL